jgi:hypothetical protein
VRKSFQTVSLGTSVNKAATRSPGYDAGVACLRPGFYATGCDGKKVEALKPVP